MGTKHLYNIIQCWTNVKGVGTTLYKSYTNVLCLLGLPGEKGKHQASITKNNAEIVTVGTKHLCSLYTMLDQCRTHWDNVVFSVIQMFCVCWVLPFLVTGK